MNISKKHIASVFALAGFFLAFGAQAATPILTLGVATDGNTVPVTVNGDPNSSVIFFYNSSQGGGLHLLPIGTTNSSGYLSTSVSASQYTIAPSTVAYVSVNNQSSAQTAWPIGSSQQNATLTLGQYSLTLYPGQQSSVAVNNPSGASVFISSNSNPAAVSATLSGNQIIATAASGTASGSSVINICYQSGGSSCASLYVTVSGSFSGTVSSTGVSFNQNNVSLAYGQTLTVLMSGSGGYNITNNSNTSVARITVSGNAAVITGYNPGITNVTVCGSDGQCGTLYVTVTLPGSTITFDQPNVTLSVGQSLNVNASGGGGYYISSNSNPSTASASATANSASILIVGNNPGTASITVCGTSSGSRCGVINATVTGTASSSSGSTASQPATFSQSSISLSAGQSLGVQVYGGTNYAVSSNSNSSVVSATLSGSIVTVTGLNPGNASITVCQNGVLCGTFFATVSGTASGSGSTLSFSQSSITLSAGTNQIVSIYGSGAFAVSGNSNPSAASASISGNNLIVSGISSGSTSISVCLLGTSTCSILYANVGTASIQALTMNPASVTLSLGQGQPVQIYGSGSYYVSSNSNPSIASAVVSGNGVIVTALAYGTTSITVCQNGTQCGTLPVIVSVAQAAPVPATILQPAPASVPPAVAAASSYRFTLALHSGSKGSEVKELQQKLKDLGYYSYAVTGTYGPITEKAVKAFQKAVGLSQLGSVGPGTRAALNSR